MTEEYAQAIWNLANKKGTSESDAARAKKLVTDLLANLKASGRSKLLPGILRALKQIEERNTRLTSMVEVAHAGESAHALKEAATHGIHAEHAHVNPQLIKGWRASSNGKLVDNSAKRSLLELYREITK